MRPILVTLIPLVVLAAAIPSAHASASKLTFAEAKALAAERDVPIVIDFFTDWCIYCKHFDRDLADASTGLAADLEQVVFTSIDAEKGEGIELAKTYGATGFPTYVVVDAEGELIGRWAGYGGPEHFRTNYETVLADPVPVATKRTAFEESPTAEAAIALAEVEMSGGDYDAAVVYYEKAGELDPTQDQSRGILQARFMQTRRARGPQQIEAFIEEARALVLVESAPVATLVDAAHMVNLFAAALGRPEEARPFLEAVLPALEKDRDSVDRAAAGTIEAIAHLQITEDVGAAVDARKWGLGDDWQDDAAKVNEFAWWCFENEINLEEARELAVHGVEIAGAGDERAQILDTLAEICNALGDCGEALVLIDQAIEEAPDDGYYKKQRERFASILEQQTAADD